MANMTRRLASDDSYIVNCFLNCNVTVRSQLRLYKIIADIQSGGIQIEPTIDI